MHLQVENLKHFAVSKSSFEALSYGIKVSVSLLLHPPLQVARPPAVHKGPSAILYVRPGGSLKRISRETSSLFAAGTR